MFMFPAPVPITEQALAKYEAKLDEAARYSKQHADSTQVCPSCNLMRRSIVCSADAALACDHVDNETLFAQELTMQSICCYPGMVQCSSRAKRSKDLVLALQSRAEADGAG